MTSPTALVDWQDLYARLSAPFPEEAIYWRAGASSRDKKRAQALPYAEPRVYEDRLNDVCGLDWAVTFKPWGDARIICELTIHGVTRSSTGEENEGFAPGTSAEAQAFKRACVKFGLGRYLYDIPIQWVDFDGKALSETPALAPKFLPAASTRAGAPLLTQERAGAMGRELDKLGYSASAQLELATELLGRRVVSLKQLTEPEALEVWTQAKRSGQRAA